MDKRSKRYTDDFKMLILELLEVGISTTGTPNSLSVNGSATNGNRSYVDNQTTFTVAQGSNLHIGTVENTGAIIGKESENNTTFKIDNYIGKDLQDSDTMNTTGGSFGVSLGSNPTVTNIGVNYDDSNKQGITRNTVIGNVEITNSTGDEINRDVTKAQETTRDDKLA